MASKTFVPGLLLISVIAVEAHAQAAKSELPSPEKIVEILRSDDRSAKGTLARRLGFVRNESIYAQFDSIDLQYAVLEAPGPQAILHAACSDCWWGFIAVLRKSKSDEKWQHVATFVTGGKHRKPKVSIQNVLSLKEKEVVIQGNEVLSGTGMWQYNLTILKLHSNRLEAIFDEPEEVNFSVPSTSDKGTYNTEQTQRSEFHFGQPLNGKPLPLQIYEKQVIEIRGKVLTRWRVFSWDNQVGRFVHNPIDRPEAPFGALRPIS